MRKRVLVVLFLFGLGMMVSGWSMQTGAVMPGLATAEWSPFTASPEAGSALVQSGAFVMFLVVLLGVLSGGRK
jgi:hypothetical protein